MLSRRSLGPALRSTAERGFAHLDGILDPAFQRALWREIRSGPLRRMEGTFGAAGVRMQIDGFDVDEPFEGFPLLRGLRDAFAERVRSQGSGIRGLATWRPNEAGIGVYRPGWVGVTSHLDGRWYRRLVAVFTIVGSARFEVLASRAGEVLGSWDARAGGLTLMRGPGLAGSRDGRPFHAVEGPRRGVRCSVALRMSVREPRD
ncbi:MAG TPA: hypothetical protein VJ913_02725 [Actinomycetota bacterium]|nr:hypothetical protein [Actinomycetota bacterium]